MKNKKILVAVLLCIMIFTTCGLIGCVPNGGSSSGGSTDTPDKEEEIVKPIEPDTPETKNYTLSLCNNYNVIKTYELAENTDIFEFVQQNVTSPSKTGFEFEGWFLNDSLTQPLNSEYFITNNVNLYAKLTEINTSFDFSQGFNGIVKTGEMASVADESGNELTKQYVLDRQFSVLSENLLFSLANVYGVNLSGRNDAGQNYYKFNLEYDNKAYSNYGNNAVFNKSNMIMHEYDIENGHVGHTSKNVIMVNCPACYAEYFVQNIPSQDHGLERAVSLSKSINGGIEWDGSVNRFAENSVRNRDIWQWSYNEGINLNVNTEAVNYVKGYVNKYKDTLKLELAKIVSGNSSVNNYEEQLGLINHAGFTTNEKGKIETLVKNKIIGSSLISIDDARLPENTNAGYNYLWTEDQHYYKAYSVLVPCIVSQALNKTFENTAQSIYPFVSFETMEKENVNKFTLETGKSVYLEISDSVNMGALAINSSIATQIIVDVCNNGKVSSSKFNINALNNYVNLPGGAQTIGAFNGKLNFSNNLYNNNNPVNIQTGELNVSKIVGNNYIKITNNTSQTIELEIMAYLEKPFNDDQIVRPA